MVRSCFTVGHDVSMFAGRMYTVAPRMYTMAPRKPMHFGRFIAKKECQVTGRINERRSQFSCDEEKNLASDRNRILVVQTTLLLLTELPQLTTRKNYLSNDC